MSILNNSDHELSKPRPIAQDDSVWQDYLQLPLAEKLGTAIAVIVILLIAITTFVRPPVCDDSWPLGQVVCRKAKP